MVAGLVIGALLAAERAADAGDGFAAATPTPEAPEIEGVLVRLALTTNMRALPGRHTELVAVIPGDRIARVTGQTPEGDWLRVVYPADSRLEGWVPAANVVPMQGDEQSAPVVDVSAPEPGEPGAGATPEPERLPDLTITHAFLLPNGNLTVRIANIGRGAFDDRVGLRITSAEGELVGVLEIERTLLAPGRSATVDTNVRITRTGVYVLEIDWMDEIRESSEFNNVLRQLLVVGGE